MKIMKTGDTSLHTGKKCQMHISQAGLNIHKKQFSEKIYNKYAVTPIIAHSDIVHWHGSISTNLRSFA